MRAGPCERTADGRRRHGRRRQRRAVEGQQGELAGGLAAAVEPRQRQPAAVGREQHPGAGHDELAPQRAEQRDARRLAGGRRAGDAVEAGLDVRPGRDGERAPATRDVLPAAARGVAVAARPGRARRQAAGRHLRRREGVALGVRRLGRRHRHRERGAAELQVGVVERERRAAAGPRHAGHPPGRAAARRLREHDAAPRQPCRAHEQRRDAGARGVDRREPSREHERRPGGERERCRGGSGRSDHQRRERARDDEPETPEALTWHDANRRGP